MKILALADEESEYYYDFYTPGKLDEFDLILSCGDLHKSYLEFFVTMARCPLLYVRGNHDDSFGESPPEGCECVEDRIFVYNGVRILGLGGSFRYRDGDNMYTEWQMDARVRRLWLQLLKYRGFDILLTHAPARHINDFDTLTHRGFERFRKLLERYRPRYFIHGHIHRTYGMRIPRLSRFGDTTVINAFEHYAFDY
ncbi:MAG: metallophosphoesterase family protein [Oscillibacter sp.]|nr:metallophosphoesterase family protein [Oscillibacter sp.]